MFLVAFSSRATSRHKLRVSFGSYKDNSYIWNTAENNPSARKKSKREAPTHTSKGWGRKEILTFLSPAFTSLENAQ